MSEAAAAVGGGAGATGTRATCVTCPPGKVAALD